MLSAVLVHPSMSEAHIVMCDTQNKVHSYLAHHLVCSCTGGNESLRRLLSPVFTIFVSAATPEYNLCYLYSPLIMHSYFVRVIFDCLHYLDFSRAGLCMQLPCEKLRVVDHKIKAVTKTWNGTGRNAP